jgi:hypothetical protein
MNKDEAFIKAYGKCVAVAPEAVVREFVSRYHEDHDDLYEEFGEYYSSIVDAYQVWESAIQFAKGKA